MKIGYLNCFAGISGDMFLAALIDAGLDWEKMAGIYRSIGLHVEDISIQTINDQGIKATTVTVKEDDHHLHAGEIEHCLMHTSLSATASRRAMNIYNRILSAESKVHGMPMDRVHLHEISAVDTIVDLLGAACGVEMLEIEKLVSSPLSVGNGTVTFSHGEFPVPAPATLEILKGIPFESGSQPGERVTPTGAAIVAELVSEFGAMPLMKLTSIGYGAGSRRDGTAPNVLRLCIGTKDTSLPIETRLIMMETNIDDQSPQIMAYACERIREIQGVLDVHIIPSQMKKNRSGHLLRILCDHNSARSVQELVFSESISLGIRSWEVSRTSVDRTFVTVDIGIGCVRVKIAGANIIPEYEECQILARKHGLPLKEIYRKVLAGVRETA